MSEREEPLDEALAHKLRAAAAHEAPTRLDATAEARVLSALLAESARLKRQQRLRTRATMVALSLAAALVLGLMLREPAAPSVARVSTPAPECELVRVAASARFVEAEGRKLLSLGRFGRIAAEHDAVVSLQSTGSCELLVSLSHGTLAAELNNLRPGKLRVRTALGDVLVRGTTFSVRVADSLEVVLLEGAVELVTSQPGTPVTRLAPGHALRRVRSNSAPELRELVGADEQTIRELFDPERASMRPAIEDAGTLSLPTRTTRSATELLAAAERARRDGQLSEARALYREAGTHSDADAEVALLRWARLELSTEQARTALDVLRRHARRFSRGNLAAEAAAIKLLALERLGRREDARAVARALMQRFPESEQAKAAARFVSP